MEAVYKIWPEKALLKTVYTIMQAAIESAEIAEKAWKMGNLEKEERNVYAKKLVKEAVNKVGITITPQIEMVINGAIEAVCMVLPHEKKPEAQEETEEEENVSAVPVVRGDE